jgi:hypothetical protein
MWKAGLLRLHLVVVAVFMSAGCAASLARPAPEALARWTTALRDAQPEEAFAAVYQLGRERLVFVAAKHANRDDSLTFRLIREAYASFRFDTVIAEGFATSRGANPSSVIKYGLESKADPQGFVEAGETAPVVVGSMQQRAELWGGEPDDLSIKARVVASGISDRDLLGFYILRNLPQWIEERKIENSSDARLPALVEAELPRRRASLGLASTVLPGHAEWSRWYESLNGKPISAGFQTEEVGPLADGQFGTNHVAYQISRSRDSHLHQLIVDRLNAGQSILVVFGASHLMIQRPALDKALGAPCYVGNDLKRAASVCR